jgi:phosphoribosylanthranilate isomerase
MTETENKFRTLKIKVCGMREKDNIQALLELNPDYIGFIFYERSVRYVGEHFDPSIASFVPPGVGKVGIFVNADQEDVIRKVSLYGLDFVQLHGRETAVYCAKLANKGIQIIKAFGIDNAFSYSGMNEYCDYCRYFLFDTRTSSMGGSGEKFNWKVLEEYPFSSSFFLSGGIGPDDTVKIADLSHLNIHALDINSRFESGPGLKNIDVVKKFIEKIRAINYEI